MKSFVKKNSYKILNQYVDKNYFNDSCKNSIFKNIRLIAGSEIEKKVKAEGLEKFITTFQLNIKRAFPFCNLLSAKIWKNISHFI